MLTRKPLGGKIRAVPWEIFQPTHRGFPSAREGAAASGLRVTLTPGTCLARSTAGAWVRPVPEHPGRQDGMATVPTITLELLGRSSGGRRPAQALQKRILVVDDDPIILESLRRLLGTLDVDVTTCADPERAIARFESEPFDLVVSDERMPKMSGLEMLRRVRARSPRTPTILVTGYANQADFERAYERCGVFRAVAKPWNGLDLVATIKDALRAADALA